jgi:hypothetical protein
MGGNICKSIPNTKGLKQQLYFAVKVREDEENQTIFLSLLLR